MNEKIFKKINSSLLIQTIKKKNSHEKTSEDALFHHVQNSKAVSPIKRNQKILKLMEPEKVTY